MAYERFYKGKTTHFVRKSEADLVSNAVWEPGQGDKIRAHLSTDRKRTRLLASHGSASLLSRTVDPNGSGFSHRSWILIF